MEFKIPDRRWRGFLIRGTHPFADLTQDRLEPGAFSIGIEEEFFLADARTLRPAAETPDRLFETADAGRDGRITREFLQAQAEAVSSKHDSLADARREMAQLRQTLAAAAAEHGLVILASGTHPTARWRKMVQTPDERYHAVMDSLQMIGERNMLCGMHVHVELPDADRRYDVMVRMLPYVPLLLALSTSSPFWESNPTGLKGYRLAAYDELPRTGLPELLRTVTEYQAYVQALVRSGAMPDSSYIWWSIRPSLKHPTLELRAPDCCTALDDAVAIAALYRTLARYLYLNPDHNTDVDAVARAIAVENKWRAQRYGVHGTFATAAGPVTVADMLDRLIDETADDAEALGCEAEIAHCRAIVANGTSADMQLAIFAERSRQDGEEAALKAVSEWIASATLRV